MAFRILIAVYGIFFVFVVIAEGIVNPFALWNALPIVIGFFLLRWAFFVPPREAQKAVPAVAFNVPAVGLVLFSHAAWVLDLDGMATSSSTAAIIFIFIPIYAIAAGVIGFLAGFMFAKIYELIIARRRTSPPPA